MVSLKVRVKRQDRLRKQIQTIPQTVKKRLAKAIDDNADEFVRDAKRDVGVRSGRLRDSIVKDEVEGTEGLAVEVETGVFYSRFEEFGTVNRPANPFFFVNFRALTPKFKRRMGRAMREGIKESLSKT